MNMPEREDLSGTLAYWMEHREQLRQSESQRAIMANYILVIAAAISGFVAQQHFTMRTIPLSILIILVGAYGALAAAKYHERADYHISQARALTRELVDAGGLINAKGTLNEFRQAHYGKYPRLARLRLYWLWIGLNVGVALYGVTLVIISFTIQ
jgi:hypothetical protein